MNKNKSLNKKIEFVMRKFRFFDDEYKIIFTKNFVYVTIGWDQIRIEKSMIRNRNLEGIESRIKEWLDL